MSSLNPLVHSGIQQNGHPVGLHRAVEQSHVNSVQTLHPLEVEPLG